MVRAAAGVQPGRLLTDMVAFLRHAPAVAGPGAISEHELAPFVRLPVGGAPDRFVHPGAPHPDAGTDLAVRAVARVGGRLTVVLAEADAAFEEALRRLGPRSAAVATSSSSSPSGG